MKTRVKYATDLVIGDTVVLYCLGKNYCHLVGHDDHPLEHVVHLLTVIERRGERTINMRVVDEAGQKQVLLRGFDTGVHVLSGEPSPEDLAELESITEGES